MLWIHNPSIFHSRTEVVDGEASCNSVLHRLHCFLTASRITGLFSVTSASVLAFHAVTSDTSALGCRLQCSTEAAQLFSLLPRALFCTSSTSSLSQQPALDKCDRSVCWDAATASSVHQTAARVGAEAGVCCRRMTRRGTCCGSGWTPSLTTDPLRPPLRHVLACRRRADSDTPQAPRYACPWCLRPGQMPWTDCMPCGS